MTIRETLVILLCLSVLFVSIAACGVKGPPLPPEVESYEDYEKQKAKR